MILGAEALDFRLMYLIANIQNGKRYQQLENGVANHRL